MTPHTKFNVGASKLQGGAERWAAGQLLALLTVVASQPASPLHPKPNQPPGQHFSYTLTHSTRLEGSLAS